MHDLRHTCATLLLAEGEPLEVIAERLGHSDTRITSQVYAHVVDELRVRAADRLDAVLAGQPDRQSATDLATQGPNARPSPRRNRA